MKTPVKRCEAVVFDLGESMQCGLPAGHDGKHQVGWLFEPTECGPAGDLTVIPVCRLDENIMELIREAYVELALKPVESRTAVEREWMERAAKLHGWPCTRRALGETKAGG